MNHKLIRSKQEVDVTVGNMENEWNNGRECYGGIVSDLFCVTSVTIFFLSLGALQFLNSQPPTKMALN
jgi:hypothetical protein